MFAKSFAVAAVTFLGTVKATQFWVNTGCVIADFNGEGEYHKVCNRDGQVWTVNGDIDIFGCIDGSVSPNTANCRYQGFVPQNWVNVNYGEDNCLYSDGGNPLQLGCVTYITAMDVPQTY